MSLPQLVEQILIRHHRAQLPSHSVVSKHHDLVHENFARRYKHTFPCSSCVLTKRCLVLAALRIFAIWDRSFVLFAVVLSLHSIQSIIGLVCTTISPIMERNNDPFCHRSGSFELTSSHYRQQLSVVFTLLRKFTMSTSMFRSLFDRKRIQMIRSAGVCLLGKIFMQTLTRPA